MLVRLGIHTGWLTSGIDRRDGLPVGEQTDEEPGRALKGPKALTAAFFIWKGETE